MIPAATGPDRRRVLRDALRRPQSIGPFSLPVVIGLGGGFVASMLADALLLGLLSTPWRQLADAAAFALVAAPLWIGIGRDDVRAAVETMTWLNGWETERWQDELGRRLPGLPRAHPRLLDTLPETMGLRPLRIELLVVRGALDEARERLERLPRDTPWQRFERTALDEWLAWWSDAPPRIEAMREAAGALVGEPERHLVARAMVAAAEARRAASTGGDAIAPLAGLRPDLGDRPRRYAFSYRTGVAINVVLIGLVASLAVMLTAAILR